MRLYHFTDTLIKDKISPNHFGTNCYTNRDKNISSIARAFFFTDSRAPEYRFTNCKYRYIVNIDDKSIYNLAEDRLGLIKKYKDIHRLLHQIKSLGYRGALYNVGYNIVIVFYSIKIDKSEVLAWL